MEFFCRLSYSDFSLFNVDRSGILGWRGFKIMRFLFSFERHLSVGKSVRNDMNYAKFSAQCHVRHTTSTSVLVLRKSPLILIYEMIYFCAVRDNLSEISMGINLPNYETHNAHKLRN
jgi:hypothetical protein